MADAIVVGIDGSEQSHKALDVAVDIAKDRPDTQIVVACAMHQPASLVNLGSKHDTLFQAEGYWQEMLPHVTEELESQAEKARAAGVTTSTACTKGEPSDVMVNIAKDVGASLIVVGSTGAGLMAEVLGSTTLRLIKKSPIPVVVVPKG